MVRDCKNSLLTDAFYSEIKARSSAEREKGGRCLRGMASSGRVGETND